MLFRWELMKDAGRVYKDARAGSSRVSLGSVTSDPRCGPRNPIPVLPLGDPRTVPPPRSPPTDPLLVRGARRRRRMRVLVRKKKRKTNGHGKPSRCSAKTYSALAVYIVLVSLCDAFPC